MRRQHVVRGNVVDIEELDQFAVRPSDQAKSREDVLSQLGIAPTSTERDLDSGDLAAFENAGWMFVQPSTELREVADSQRSVAGVETVQRVFRRQDGRLVLGSDRISVRLRDDLSEQDVESVLEAHAVRAVNRLKFAPNLFEVRVEPGSDFLQVSMSLVEDPAVLYAEPQFVEHISGRHKPTDPLYGQQWHLNNSGQEGGSAGADVAAETAWDTSRGSGVRIAVIDNGFNVAHPDLAEAVEPTSGFFDTDSTGQTVFRRTVVGYPEILGQLDAAGRIFGHGTFCATMALARAGNDAGGVGVAPEAGFVAIACLNDTIGTQTTLARAVAYAADPSLEAEELDAADGADVISCSLGPNDADWHMTQTLEDAIDFAVQHGRGGRGAPIFWAVTNGNFEIRFDEVCSHPSTIGVGRSTRDDLEHGCGSGPELDFLATGVSVLSGASDSAGNGAYGVSTGTSFAAPTAAGVGALVLSVNPNLTWHEVRDLMHSTCDKVGGVTYDATGHHDDYGFGRVNAARAVSAAAGPDPVNRFQRVCQVLDESVGGPDKMIGVHGAFWRGVTRDQFVAKRVSGKDLLVVGKGAGSNLVLALKGESPFGADLETPPPDAAFSRMPSGRPAVPAEAIAFVEQWIDDGCPDDQAEPSPLLWRPTNAPAASSRSDDVWFLDANRGWAVNSNGQILHTEDGGDSWAEQFHDENVYFRCVGFASDTRGWVGTLTSNKRLLDTSDGGATWTVVSGLPSLAPSAVCGLSVVNTSVVYASGTNFPNRPPRVMKTVDGGATWTAVDMSAHATLLIDIYFTDPDHGWVVGGRAEVANPTRDDVRAVVLHTEDGGATWVNRLTDLTDQLPLGEWGWKIQFLDDQVGFVSLESFSRGAILKTTDGGLTWTRIEINDPQHNANLEGVGFIDENDGWVGGWGSASFEEGFSSTTTDGGKTWQDANEIGRFINRFRFIGTPVTVGYASGRTVYKYSAEPLPTPAAAAPVAEGTRLLENNAPMRSGVPIRVEVIVPDGADHLLIDVWDRFGEHVRRLVDESQPVGGRRSVDWDLTDSAGEPVTGRSFIFRVTADGHSESQIAQVTR